MMYVCRWQLDHGSVQSGWRDAQAWYAPHPPRRGTAFTPTRPYVHQGFLKTWHANGLNVRVVSRVKEIVEALRDEGRAVHLYITGAGHSRRGLRPVLITCLCVSCCTA